MAFRWRADAGTTLNAGLVALWVFFQRIRTSIARKPYIFVFFQGSGGVLTPFPPLDPPITSLPSALYTKKLGIDNMDSTN